MRLRRGRRSINFLCLVRWSILLCCVFVSFVILHVLSTVISYHHFTHTFQFSNVSFWKDDRITSKTPLLPITEIEKVNLTNSTIVITACCRNVRRNLPGFQRNIQSIAKLFGNYRIYLGESDSDDETLTYLNQWKNNDSDHVRVYTYGQQRWKLMSRT